MTDSENLEFIHQHQLVAINEARKTNYLLRQLTIIIPVCTLSILMLTGSWFMIDMFK
jgi:hypothetical protein